VPANKALEGLEIRLALGKWQRNGGGATKNVILALGELGKHKITLIRNSNVAHAE